MAAKYEIADEAFADAGLHWYEISNWARPGYESRHNLGYWRNVDWAGIGPGAHSHYRLGGEAAGVASCSLESGVGDNAKSKDLGADDAVACHDDAGFRKTAAAAPGTSSISVAAGSVGLRAWDIAHPRAWAHAINAGTVPWGGCEGITAQEDREETLMLGLRLREGFDTSRFAGIIPDEAWVSLQSEGLVTLAPGSRAGQGCIAVPTLRGRLLNDIIIEHLFDYL